MIKEQLERAVSRWDVEMHLLLACCRFSPSDREIETIKDLCRKVVNWKRFLDLVKRHRVHPVVYRNVDRYTREYVPGPVVQALKARFQANLLATLRLSAELTRVSQLLEKSGIPMLCLKGPVLALRLFGDVAWRHYRDLDLLINAVDLDQADKILLAQGYIQSSHGVKLSELRPSQRNYVLTHIKDFEYRHQERQTTIELHWNPFINMTSEQAADTRRFFESGLVHPLWGTSIRSLSDVDTMLYLCEHGTRHAFSRLKWLVDIVELLGCMKDTSWKNMVETAEQGDLSRNVGLSLLLAHCLLGVPLPAPVAAIIDRDQAMPDLIGFFIRVMDEPEGKLDTEGKVNMLWWTLYWMKLKRKASSKWPICSGFLYSANDFKEFNLPDVFFPIYPLLRPFLWFKRYHVSGPKKVN
ncbi:MAG: nucleotidyltransferase family protein [Deltaproteobacteria bacterium]|nr:nucleotidyltransferase family protein [Deltaproteobacteria bacterium]